MRNEEYRLTRSCNSSGNCCDSSCWGNLLCAESGDEDGVSRRVVRDEELGFEGEEEARARDSRHERAPFVEVST